MLLSRLTRLEILHLLSKMIRETGVSDRGLALSDVGSSPGSFRGAP